MTPASLMAEPTLDLAALTGPTIRRHLLGAELRRLRLARSLRLEDAADRLSLAPSTVSRIEAGKAPARTSYVALMLDLYQVQDLGVRRTLTDLAREGRRDIDLVNLTIRIERQLTTTREGERTFGPPKSKAGVRTVSFPRVILPELRDHLTAFVGEDDNALVFTSPDRPADAAQQLLPPLLDQGRREGGSARHAFSRLAPRRKYPHGRRGREPP